MPETDCFGILISEEIEINELAFLYQLYLTPAQKKINADIEGDPDVKGFIQQVSGSFPGTALKASEWMYNNLNEGFVAIQRYCDDKYSKVFGSKYNPLFLTGRIAEDNESNLCDITLKQVKRSKKPFLYYNKEINTDMLYDNIRVLSNQDKRALNFNNILIQVR
ncbi:hypothetical protein [Elizabethkingia ursingii]|nr:hypothetical protein [Elizabethkingia ursingii]